MRKPFEPEKLKIDKDREGLSLKMIQQHFKLYEGYVKKTNEIREKLETADKKEANGVYSFYGELKRQETFAVNGMKLHEYYFAHLQGDGNPRGEMVKMIEKDFGTLDAWKEEMVAVGICSRGWAILAYDFKDMRLHVYGGDAHNIAVWNCAVLIALDVYEHAYFMDYGVDRKTYIDSFFKNLDWDLPNKLIKDFNLSHHLMKD
ncbi:MAG: Fe-Mn family superoxide dismutase [Candidatus Liptonbacteria bacterium]|nr:Fe-Mn family superoxide dismutase [Candidatus Liptonbacteria bacterium]